MQGSLFDNLKDLKTQMKENEKKENDKKEEVLRAEKEKKLQVDFEKFMKSSGIKKLS